MNSDAWLAAAAQAWSGAYAGAWRRYGNDPTITHTNPAEALARQADAAVLEFEKRFKKPIGIGRGPR